MASSFNIYNPVPLSRIATSSSSRNNSVSSGIARIITSSSRSNSIANADIPPPYSPSDLTSQFQKVDLTAVGMKTKKPTRSKVIAHLELLHVIQTLREKISGTDGLYELYDDQLCPDGAVDAETRELLLSKLKEKRWTIYVTKAVDRFTTWWNSWKKEIGMQELRIREMSRDDGVFEKLVHIKPKRVGPTTKSRLPPLDVLMVWHAFMLNPRCYLEDCLRHGMMPMWQGMPWDAVSQSVDYETWTFAPGDEAKNYFEANTGLDWDSIDSLNDKFVQCPYHNEAESFPVPWSTCGDEIRAEGSRIDANGEPSIPRGVGFADMDFEATCPTCDKAIDHQKLCGGKFRRDVRECLLDPASQAYSTAEALSDCIPMPGTVLTLDGLVENFTLSTKHEKRLFPNKLLIAMVKNSARTNDWDTIELVRDDIERALSNGAIVSAAAEMSWKDISISRTQRVAIRKMMSHYWDNSSDFALDLVGAVIRQGSFVEKMYNFDWLHSPALDATVDRLIMRYERFFLIMASMDMAVPTLDVDLAWHTHQLSPQAYYFYSISKCPRKFIDHDDKIAETKLSDAFEETSRVYQKLYSEPYSLCACWYCEAVRCSYATPITRMLRRSSVPPVESQLHDPLDPAPTDPDLGPHISAHNAIRPKLALPSIRAKQVQLEKWFDRACKRARKEGRTPPQRPKEVETEVAVRRHFGGTMPYLPLWVTPFFMPTYFDTGVYASNPSCANLAPGAHGNCAAGTCGGAVAAGSCGGSGQGACLGGQVAGGCGGHSGRGLCGAGGLGAAALVNAGAAGTCASASGGDGGGGGGG